jgi:hypothetical protein
VHVAVAIEQQVRGLHVAMDDAVRMRAVERLGRLLEPRERLAAELRPARRRS